ncbi:hypothetical protein ERJ75_000251900 [Trypanosoma vivax]|uniref:Uncharacterized protein n=1 Tax=Trypanosoma vivax (strain Y486) TaxID=1055687 RepID=F9WQA2_TRYVY|nr:hypothetical protein TRVL_05699 [Trypanosoma vivax]KAH8618661.1 hypothetical protein ERJ75_000251900 [Trypanosoma vivax]CCD19729.1 hypothetical protein, conserved [Trypanosoma vivax Y486]|eukprot:CCD19729.1 hypothetical protein, conserved [Trypanosoma vivax Y486]
MERGCCSPRGAASQGKMSAAGLETVFGAGNASRFSLFNALNNNHFSRNAETLAPYPDGVRVQTDQCHIANPGLMNTATSVANPVTPHLIMRASRSTFPSISKSDRRGFSTVRHAEVAQSFRQLSHSDNDMCSSNYWTLMYVTEAGDSVGHLRIAAPRIDGDMSFEKILSVIEQSAVTSNLRVLYVTYFDKDFETYALLTPLSVQYCTSVFHVIVELPKSSTYAAAASLNKTASDDLPQVRGVGLVEDVSSSGHEGERKRPINSRSVVTSLLFRAPRATKTSQRSGTVQHQEPPQLGPEHEKLIQEERSTRWSLLSDEASCRLILQASESTALYKKMRAKRMGELPAKAADTVSDSGEVATEDGRKTYAGNFDNKLSVRAIPTSLLHFSMLSPCSTMSSSVKPPHSTMADTFSPLVTTLRFTPEGGSWAPLMLCEQRRLQDALAEDLSLCLNVGREGIVTYFEPPDTFSVDVMRYKGDNRTAAQIQLEVNGCHFPNVTRLFLAYKNGNYPQK